MIHVLTPLQPFLSDCAGSHRPDPAVAPRRGWRAAPALATCTGRQENKSILCLCAPNPPVPPTRAGAAPTRRGNGAESLSCFSSRRPLRPWRQPPPSLRPVSPDTGWPALGRARERAALPRTSASGRLWMWRVQTLEPQVGDGGGYQRVQGCHSQGMSPVPLWGDHQPDVLFGAPGAGSRPAAWGWDPTPAAPLGR